MTTRRLAPVLAVIAAASVAPLSLPAASTASASKVCGAVRHFSGSGGRSLGNLTLARDSVLSWRNDGLAFQVITRDGVPVNSGSHSGTAELGKGTLVRVQITAMGNWAMTITPRCTPPTSAGSYAGVGGKVFPSVIHVPRASVLTWTSAGGTFMIVANDLIPVNSKARHGTAQLPAGSYSRFIVNATGPWKITIKGRSTTS
jgi:hypothetical protein